MSFTFVKKIMFFCSDLTAETKMTKVFGRVLSVFEDARNSPFFRIRRPLHSVEIENI